MNFKYQQKKQLVNWFSRDSGCCCCCCCWFSVDVKTSIDFRRHPSLWGIFSPGKPPQPFITCFKKKNNFSITKNRKRNMLGRRNLRTLPDIITVFCQDHRKVLHVTCTHLVSRIWWSPEKKVTQTFLYLASTPRLEGKKNTNCESFLFESTCL